MNIVIDVIFIIGIVFALCSVLGMLRMPDTYNRMQASTIISTIVIILVVIGGIVYVSVSDFSNKAEWIKKLAVIGLF